MRLDRDALDMIATARIFADVDLMQPPDEAPPDPADVAEFATVAGVDGADVPDEGALLIAAVIGASQVLISALLDIIDSDDEAALAMLKDTLPGAEGPAVELDGTLFAAWADTRDMAKHWAEQARARELEVRRDMGNAMTATVNGVPVIKRVKRTEQVRAHPRSVDYLKLIGLDGGPLK